MAHHRAPGPLTRMARGALVMVAAAVMAVTLTPVTGASAALTPTGGGSGSGSGNSSVISRSGNGKFNKNNLSVNDPSFVHGNQHVFNENIGGQNPTQTAFCKRKFRHCRITQRMIVRDP